MEKLQQSFSSWVSCEEIGLQSKCCVLSLAEVLWLSWNCSKVQDCQKVINTTVLSYSRGQWYPCCSTCYMPSLCERKHCEFSTSTLAFWNTLKLCPPEQSGLILSLANEKNKCNVKMNRISFPVWNLNLCTVQVNSKKKSKPIICYYTWPYKILPIWIGQLPGNFSWSQCQAIARGCIWGLDVPCAERFPLWACLFLSTIQSSYLEEHWWPGLRYLGTASFHAVLQSS